MFIVVNDYKCGGQTKLGQLFLSSVPDHALFRVIDTKDGVVETISKSDIKNAISGGLQFCSDIVRDYDFANWFITTMTKANVLKVDLHKDVNFKSKVVDLLNKYNRLQDKEFNDLRFYYVDFGDIVGNSGSYYLRFFNDNEEWIYFVGTYGVFKCRSRVKHDFYVGTIIGSPIFEAEDGIVVKYLSYERAACGVVQFFDKYGKFMNKHVDVTTGLSKKVSNKKGVKLCMI